MIDRDNIIRMAREAGLLTIGTADGSEAVYTWPKGITEELERFAALVAAAEREACAKIADEAGPYTAADLIRARGRRQHITNGGPCWCNPETTYTDPDTGASVIVHRDPQ